MTKTYLELIQLPTRKERFEYLKLDGQVGKETFGHDRYLNQILYTSKEWRQFRIKIIARDNGCDMALEGYELDKYIIIHHINPITVEDILNRDPKVFDPNNVICVSAETHKAIHYGCYEMLAKDPVIRSANDTCPWKH